MLLVDQASAKPVVHAVADFMNTALRNVVQPLSCMLSAQRSKAKHSYHSISREQLVQTGKPKPIKHLQHDISLISHFVSVHHICLDLVAKCTALGGPPDPEVLGSVPVLMSDHPWFSSTFHQQNQAACLMQGPLATETVNLSCLAEYILHKGDYI